MAFHTNYNEAPWRKVSIEDLTTPKPGRIVRAGAYWAITDDGFALYYKGSAQCNVNESLCKRIRPDCTPLWIGMTFEPHNCHDYV